MRQIVSFVCLPVRHVFRRVGRAFRHLASSVWSSFQVKDLSTVADEVFEAHAELEYTSKCLRC